MSKSIRDIQVSGAKLHVHVEGEGPAVLLVHGFPDDHEIWRFQIPALVAAGYRVIAPDTRGCGNSELLQGKSNYKLDMLVNDLKELLDALEIDKVRLVAHDWGAIIGWHFALAHPERIEKYAALSVGHPYAYANGSIEQKLKAWYVILFQAPVLAEFCLRVFNWAILRSVTNCRIEIETWIAKLSRPGRLTAGINYYRANIRQMFKSKPEPVKMPVMGIYSTEDRFLSEDQMQNSRALVKADFRYEKLDGVGHWMQVEAPEQVNSLLLDFLGD